MVLTKENNGSENFVEVREDEEQAIKLQGIIDLLLAAGYFRARIKGISSFDKVVGGLTWCIEICNYDIDVDLLFQENLSIGQKIALTEKIVAVIPTMGCPNSLEPHQIQGLDCINIFPVVQWLVKRAMEVRAETGDYVRAFSLLQFSKDESTVSASKFSTYPDPNITVRLKKIYRPTRSFKRLPVEHLGSKEERVKGTLFEYGLLPSAGQVTETVHDEVLSTDFTQIQGAKENRISFQAISQVMGRRINDVAEAVHHFAELQSEREAVEAPGLKRTKAHLEDLLTKAQTDYNASLVKLTELQEERRALRDQKEDLDEREKRLHELETEENKPVLEDLKRLVQESENLKSEERAYKQHCKLELEHLQRQIEEADKANRERANRPAEELLQELELLREKLVEARQNLAAKSQAVAGLERKLDAVPSRAELTQYQRRFLELYQQVSSKHRETKQYYILYNTLDDTRLYINKELNILNSLIDNYEKAMHNPAAKEEYVQQMEVVAQGVQASQIKVKRELDKFREKRNSLATSLQELTDLQRRYLATVRDLREECKRHEYLLSQFPPSSH